MPGIVVGITPADYPGDPLAGIAFQRHWEERAFAAGGANLRGAGAARRRFPRAARLRPRSAMSCRPIGPA